MVSTKRLLIRINGGERLEKSQPIGVFDSGVGGISVLRELLKLMPQEDYLYVGDSLHAPYGTKSLEEVRELTVNHVNFLLENGAKGIVIACNTATSAAVAKLRLMYPDVPLVGIEPAIKPAVLYKENSTVLVMATPMTLRNEKFLNLMHQYDDRANIIALPCPGLMEFIEKGDLDGEDLRRYLKELFWSVDMKKVDSIVLGCTHYPFAKKMISEAAGENITIFDGGEGTAREMKRRLSVAGLLNAGDKAGKVTFHNSRDTEKMQKLCQFLLELPVT